MEKVKLSGLKERHERHILHVVFGNSETEYMTYIVVVDYDSEERVYNVSVPALPGCFAWGKTKSQAVTRIKEVIRTFLDAMIDIRKSDKMG